MKFTFPPRARAALTALLVPVLAGTLLTSGTSQAGVKPQTGVTTQTGVTGSASYERRGRMIDLTLASAALDGKAHARVLLPPGYDRFPWRRWPVLYLLHGCCSPEPGWTQWTGHTDIEERAARYGAIVVMPDGGSHGFYSNWRNGGRYGPPAWERFHLRELRRFVERRLRANGRRAIAGFSMGGFGALSYAARHPGMFRAVASYSGLVDSRAGAANVLAVIEGMGDDPLALWGDLNRQEEIWRAHNPADLIARLRGTPVYISAGDGRPGPLDPPGQENDPLESWIGPMNARFAELAREHGVRLSAHLYGPGTHSWPYWEREMRRSLPFLMRAIGATRCRS